MQDHVARLGGLLQVGRGERAVGWVGEVLTARNRNLVGATAPPTGLYLVDVQYGTFELPRGEPPLILRALGDVW